MARSSAPPASRSTRPPPPSSPTWGRCWVASSPVGPGSPCSASASASPDRRRAGTASSTRHNSAGGCPARGHAPPRFALPVLVENNVNALAMAERLYGVGRRHEDLLVVTIGTGVGSAVVVDGAVVRGSAGSAGELAHFPIVEDGVECSCGSRGCLETLISEPALVRAALEAWSHPRGIRDRRAAASGRRR